MTFWVRSDSYTEVVSMYFSYVLDKVNRPYKVLVAVFFEHSILHLFFNAVFLFSRWIASKC